MAETLRERIDAAYKGWLETEDTTMDFGNHCARIAMESLPCRCRTYRQPLGSSFYNATEHCDRCQALASLTAGKDGDRG